MYVVITLCDSGLYIILHSQMSGGDELPKGSRCITYTRTDIHIDTYILTECLKPGVLFSVAPMLTQLFTGRFIPRTLPHMETHTPGGGGICVHQT